MEPSQTGSGFGGAIFNLNGRVEILASTLAGNQVLSGAGQVGAPRAVAPSTASPYTLLQRQATLLISNSISNSAPAARRPPISSADRALQLTPRRAEGQGFSPPGTHPQMRRAADLGSTCLTFNL